RQSDLIFHYILDFCFSSYTFCHLLIVLNTRLLNNIRSIVTGCHNEKIAPTIELAPETPVAPSPTAPSPTIEGEGKAEEEPENMASHQTSEPELKADAQENPKDEGGVNEKSKS